MIARIKRKIHNLISDKKFSEILTGSAWAMMAKVISTGLTFVISILVTRLYGAEAMGILALIQSYLMLTTIFTELGTKTSILRLIPEHIAKYSVNSAFKVYRKTQYLVGGVSLVTGVILFFAAGVIADKVFSKPHWTFFFAVSAAFVFFKSLMELNTQAIRGLRLIRVYAVMNFLPAAIMLIILIGLTFVSKAQGNPVYAQLAALAATAIIGLWVMDKAFRTQIKKGDIVQIIPVKFIISLSLPMLMTEFMRFSIVQLGLLFLGIFCSGEVVGYYSIAVKLGTLTAFFLQAINSIVAPKFSELFYSGKMDDLFHVAKKSSKLIFYATTPILLSLVIFGKPILRFFFGPEYVAAYPSLVMLVIGQFINSISGSTADFMNMTGRQEVFRNIFLLAVIINILLNLLLIPSFSLLGSAISAMVSMSFWNISTLIYIQLKNGKTTGYFPDILALFKFKN
jgi:O-antigen/teichoic acid export membrane protein